MLVIIFVDFLIASNIYVSVKMIILLMKYLIRVA